MNKLNSRAKQRRTHRWGADDSLEGGGIEHKGKRTHGLDNSVVIAGEWRGIRGLDGNGKNKRRLEKKRL